MKTKKIVLLSGLFLIILSIIIVTGLFVLSKQIPKYQTEIQTELSKALGHEVTFAEIKADWRGIWPGLKIRKVQILDKEHAKPILTIRDVFVIPKIKTLVLDRKFEWKQVELRKIKIALRVDDEGKFSILLPDKEIPLDSKIFSLLENENETENKKIDLTGKIIKIEKAEIDLNYANLHIKQWISGQLKKNNRHQPEWHFDGKHSFKIGEGAKTPFEDFTFKMMQETINHSDQPDNSDSSDNSDKTAESEQKDDPINTIQKASIKFGSHKIGGNCQLSLADESFGYDCHLHLQDLPVNVLKAYLPQSTQNLDWLAWLKKSIRKGEVAGADIKISKNKEQTDWTGTISFKDTELDFADNWPTLKNLYGHLALSSDSIVSDGNHKILSHFIDIKIDKGEIFDTPIESLSSKIGPIGGSDKPTVVAVDGKIKSDFETSLLFLQNSPLKDSIGKSVVKLNPEGPMDLHLKLNIPLSGEETVVGVDGVVSTTNATLTLEDWNKELSNVTGSFHFTENSIDAKEVHLTTLNRPLELSIVTIPNETSSQIKISTLGTYSIDFFKQFFNSPLLDKLEGESTFDIGFQFPMNQTDVKDQITWIISSDMKGITVSLPEPLGKVEQTVRPTTVTVYPLEDTLQKVEVTIKNLLNTKLVLEKGETFSLKKGHLAFGEEEAAQWTTKEILWVTGIVPTLKMTDWLTFLEEDNGVSLSIPMNIQIMSRQLDIFGFNLYDTKLSHSTQTKLSWQMLGPLVSGVFSFPSPNEKAFNLKFDYLKFKSEKSNEALIPELLTKKQKVPVYFYCKDLRYNDMQFGTVSFSLFPKNYGYEIYKLRAGSRSYEIQGDGEWHMGDDPYTYLKGQMVSANMGDAFSKLGFESNIRGSKGRIIYQFQWPGSPFEYTLSAVQGDLSILMDNGSIVGIDHGLGRLLGIVNNPLFNLGSSMSQGFSFKTIQAEVALKDGWANTDKVLIDGSSAKIDLNGSTNLKTKELDLNMLVAPKVGIGTVGSAAALITFNPLIGVGAWALDKMTGSRYMDVVQYAYRVTGTWNNPRVESSKQIKKRIQEEKKTKNRRR